ncbi:MAG: hypothetical protein ACJ77F_01090 [Chloroflexota bacterium]
MIWRLGLAAVVVVVTGLAIAGVVNVAAARIITIGDAVLSFSALAVNLGSRRRLLRSVDAIKSTVPVVVNEPILTPRPDVAAMIASVRALGYDLIGATDTTVIDRAIRTWVLTRRDGDVWVEVGIAAGPVAIFLSEARAGRFVETSYPTGSQMDVPELLAGPVSSSARDALGTQVERLASLGGPRRSVVTMDDYLNAEKAQRASNGGLRIRKHLDQVLGPSIRDFSISLVVDVVAFGILLVVPA